MNLSKCMICNKVVQQMHWYDDPECSVHNYSCGCIAKYFRDRVEWEDSTGERFLIIPRED